MQIFISPVAALLLSISEHKEKEKKPTWHWQKIACFSNLTILQDLDS